MLNLANHISLLTCPVYFLRNVLKNSILNIKIMRTCCARWLSIGLFLVDFVNLIVYMCRVELLSFFLFHLSYFCLFCLLVLPYYVNKVEYILLYGCWRKLSRSLSEESQVRGNKRETNDAAKVRHIITKRRLEWLGNVLRAHNGRL